MLWRPPRFQPSRAALDAAPPAAGNVAITFRVRSENTTDGTSFTFTGINIVSSTDDLIIGVSARNTGQITSTGITVNGVAATKRVQLGEGIAPTENHAQIWTCPSQGDSTPDIVVTWSGTALRCGVAVWTMTGHASLVPSDTDSSTADPGAVTLTIPDNGAAVGVAAHHNNDTYTWTGLTEAFDQAFGEGSMTWSGANADFVTGGATALQVDFSAGSLLPRSVFAAWSP